MPPRARLDRHRQQRLRAPRHCATAAPLNPRSGGADDSVNCFCIGPRRTADEGTLTNMAQKVWTAAELERLSPAEQDAIFTAGIVRDLADVPPEFLARVRARLEDHIAGTEPPAQ